MHAYDEQYLDDAMRNLGEAADYAVNACNITLQKFFDLFVTTGFATQFGNGVPKIISGLSGTELVHEIVIKAGIEQDLPEVQTEYDCSPEYWCGWIVAYYQWHTGRTFKDIFQNVSAKEIEKSYQVRVDGIIDQTAVNKLIRGVLVDGVMTKRANVEIVSFDRKNKSTLIIVTITEGRNRQVRKMCEAVGFPVKKLKRVSFGGITLDGLSVGEYRPLKPHEVKVLYSL